MPQTNSKNNNMESSGHVAVLAFPFGTHAAPLLAIIRRLATLSPATHFSFFSTQQSNASMFFVTPTSQLPNNIKVYNVWDGVPDGYVLAGKPQEHIELFMKAAPEGFRKGMEAAVAEMGREVSCLVSDAFLWFTAEMAEEMKVDWVPFWASGAISLCAHLHTDYIREVLEGGLGTTKHEDENLKLIPGMFKIRINDLPEGVVFGNLDSLFSRMLHKMGIVLPQAAAAVFINSFEELEPTITSDLKSKFKKFLNIAPINLLSSSQLPPSSPAAPVAAAAAAAADTYGCIAWLDKQKIASSVYLSFGSATTPPPHELVALAEALEATKVPFLWSLRDNAKVHLPNGFLERTKLNGIVVPWAPQPQVLAHGAVGVFITHCGWNSVLESITGGVPMICRPLFGDQRLNGRMVQDVWKIGVVVEGGVFTKNGLINCLDQMLSREKGQKIRDNVRAHKELAIKATRPEGSSTNNFLALLDLVTSKKKS